MPLELRVRLIRGRLTLRVRVSLAIVDGSGDGESRRLCVDSCVGLALVTSDAVHLRAPHADDNSVRVLLAVTHDCGADEESSSE